MAAVQTINRWLRAEARGNLNHRVFSPAFGAFITLHAWQWQSTLPFQPAVREECSSLKKGLPAEGCLDQKPPAVLLSMAMVRDGFPFPSFVSAGATYFSGIRRAARSSALWASRS